MKMDSPHPLDLTRAASAFAALGSEQRLSVLRTLVRAGPDGLSIGELGERTGVTYYPPYYHPYPQHFSSGDFCIKQKTRVRHSRIT